VSMEIRKFGNSGTDPNFAVRCFEWQGAVAVKIGVCPRISLIQVAELFGERGWQKRADHLRHVVV
jgi:hypothetical protein